ncbi:MAG: hypothetical protein AAGK97_03865, partial [Bacteroidota bacterium]
EGQTLEAFLNSEVISDQMLESFISANNSNIKFNPYDHKEEIKTLMKSRVAKHYFGDLGMYKVMHENDPYLDAVHNAFKNENPFTENLN